MASSNPPPARPATQSPGSPLSPSASEPRPVTEAGQRRFGELFVTAMVEHFEDLRGELSVLGRQGLQLGDLALVLFDPLSAARPRVTPRQQLLANYPEVAQSLDALMNEVVLGADDLCVVVFLVDDSDLLVGAVPWARMAEADALMASTHVRPLPTAAARAAWVSWVMHTVGSTLPPAPE